MESPDQPSFIWVPDPIPQCLACGDDLYADDADLQLEGPDGIVEYTLELGHCDHCGRWYGVLDDLDYILDAEVLSPLDVDAFWIDEEPMEAGLWLNPDLGTIPWTFYQEYITQAEETKAAPPPEPDEVRALDVLAEAWEVGVRPAAWIGAPEDDEAELAYMAVVVDGSGLIRGNALHTEAPHDADALATLILRAAASPAPPGTPGRPEAVHVADATLADALSDRLADAGISVRTAPTRYLKEVFESLVGTVGHSPYDPYFSAYSEKEIQAYFDKARAFYQARPWKRLEGHKYVGVQLDGEPWRYVNVMGQMDEEPGLSLFDDWLHLCRFIHNAPSFFEAFTDEGNLKPIRAAGALEGVTLGPLALLHPEDGAYLRRLGIQPLAPGAYPLPTRFTADGSDRPRLPLPAYGALMDAIREAVAKRRATPVTSIKETFEIDGITLNLRYPSKGEESLPDEADAFRLVIYGGDDPEAYEENLPGKRIHVDAPGQATLEDVARAIRDASSHLWVVAFGSGNYALWDTAEGRGAPNPYVVQLRDVPELWMETGFDTFPMEVRPHPSDDVPDDIQVSIVPS